VDPVGQFASAHPADEVEHYLHLRQLVNLRSALVVADAGSGMAEFVHPIGVVSLDTSMTMNGGWWTAIAARRPPSCVGTVALPSPASAAARAAYRAAVCPAYLASAAGVALAAA